MLGLPPDGVRRGDAARGAGNQGRARASGDGVRAAPDGLDQRRAAPRLDAFDEIFADFDRFEGLLSIWRDGSDVQRLNAAAGLHPVTVSAETIDVLSVARQVGDWTDGKFDITFGALSDLWKFDHDQDDRSRHAPTSIARLPLIDYRAGRVRRGRRDGVRQEGRHAGAPRRHRQGLRRRSRRRHAPPARPARLHGPGRRRLYVGGRRGDRPWRLGIQDPRGPGRQQLRVCRAVERDVQHVGDYERFFIKDGRRYHHILDPDRGEPACGCRSVTIVSDRAVLADALSTGVFVLARRKAWRSSNACRRWKGSSSPPTTRSWCRAGSKTA